ncbi:MAG: flippase-like domain-containing protein [Gammaproteobacteria bacterium]|nr:flippase-like domain-containing protein [Gammaproteobacteria bacterium]
MVSAALARNVLIGIAGVAIGAVFMVLALRGIDVAEVRRLAAAVDRAGLVQATALYWVALGLRVLRWQRLLGQLGGAPLIAVAETLVVGYAVNNLLPARLGEVARAAYAKRRLALGRARVFGTIVVERLLDLLAILTCLIAGLAGVGLVLGHARLPTFELVALNAGVLVGVAVLALALLRSARLARLSLPAAVHAVVDDFRHGTRSLNRRTALLVVALTAAVWTCEVLALSRVFAACGAVLGPAEALVVMGAASLSTLVPTAPGYLGTYQLVAVLALQAFGLDGNAGIVASTAIQAALFGSVTVVGLAILLARGTRRAWLTAADRRDRHGAGQSSSENGVKSVSRS